MSKSLKYLKELIRKKPSVMSGGKIISMSPARDQNIENIEKSDHIPDFGKWS